MVKKILSSIILIMIVCCSTFVYSTEPEISTDTTLNAPKDNTIEEDKTTSGEIKKDDIDTDSDSSSNDDTNIDNDKNNDSNNTIKDSNTDSNNTTNGNNNSSSDTKKDTSNSETTKLNNNKKNTNNSSVQKSSEARLSSLKVDKEGLTPEFDKNITEYYLIVDLNVKQIKITTNTVNEKATVTIQGNKNLKDGQNTVTINVVAEDGTENTYYIYVTKVDSVELANAELESLEIEAYSLYPSFRSNIYSYNININENITSLNINPTAKSQNASVVIEGNTNLKKGENLIKIIVTAEDDITVKTYKINVYIDSNVVEIQEESKIPAIILIAILSLCILILGIYIVIKNKR